MLRMMATAEGTTGPVNVGSEFSMLELAEKVIKLTRSERKLVSSRSRWMTRVSASVTLR